MKIIWIHWVKANVSSKPVSPVSVLLCLCGYYKITYVACIVFPLDSFPLKLGGERRPPDFDANPQQGRAYWRDQGEARGKDTGQEEVAAGLPL